MLWPKCLRHHNQELILIAKQEIQIMYTQGYSSNESSPGTSWQKKYRIQVLLTIVVIQLCIYAAIHTVMLLEEGIVTNYKINISQYAFLYRDYIGSFTVLFCGYFISKFGRGPATIAVLGIVVVGQFFSSLSTINYSYRLLVIGQWTLSCGLDYSFVLLYTYLVVWFKNKETTLAIAIPASTSFIVSEVGYYLQDALYIKYPSLRVNFWTVFGLTVLSFMLGFVLKYFDSQIQAEEQSASEQSKQVALNGSHAGYPLVNNYASEQIETGFGLIRTIPRAVWLIVAIMLTMERGFISFNRLRFSLLLNFWGISFEASELIVRTSQIATYITAIIVGVLVYISGRKPQLMFLSSIGIAVAMIGMFACRSSALGFIGVVLYYLSSIAYGVFIPLAWPCVAYSVSERAIGITIGIILGLTMSAGTLFWILEERLYYISIILVQVISIVLGVVGAYFAYRFMKNDDFNGRVLAKPEKYLSQRNYNEGIMNPGSV